MKVRTSTCYRVMVHDKDTLALYISPGKQGRIIRQNYFDQGRPCPVAISFGDDPLLLTAAANSVVDDDIDPYDINNVMWAMCTRSDPANDTDFIRRAWSGPLDPVIPKDKKGFSTRAVIDGALIEEIDGTGHIAKLYGK